MIISEMINKQLSLFIESQNECEDFIILYSCYLLSINILKKDDKIINIPENKRIKELLYNFYWGHIEEAISATKHTKDNEKKMELIKNRYIEKRRETYLEIRGWVKMAYSIILKTQLAEEKSRFSANKMFDNETLGFIEDGY